MSSKPEQLKSEIDSMITDVVQLDGSHFDRDPRAGFVSLRNVNLGEKFGTTPERARVAQNATVELAFDPKTGVAHKFSLSDAAQPKHKGDAFNGWSLIETRQGHLFKPAEVSQAYSTDVLDGTIMHTNTATYGKPGGVSYNEESTAMPNFIELYPTDFSA